MNAVELGLDRPNQDLPQRLRPDEVGWPKPSRLAIA